MCLYVLYASWQVQRIKSTSVKRSNSNKCLKLVKEKQCLDKKQVCVSFDLGGWSNQCPLNIHNFSVSTNSPNSVSFQFLSFPLSFSLSLFHEPLIESNRCWAIWLFFHLQLTNTHQNVSQASMCLHINLYDDDDDIWTIDWHLATSIDNCVGCQQHLI